MAETTTAPAMDDFATVLEKANIIPLWDRYHDILPLEPTSPDNPMQWRWSKVGPFVERAARDVSMENAVRRVLMLVHPAFNGQPFTTTNLFAGIQIMEPGDVAPMHRHSPSAMRFIMEGGGGVTMVNGQRCEMDDGDLILTPNWAWHEHVNDSDKRIVWLDALDVPLAANLGTLFSEHSGSNDFPSDKSMIPDDAFAAAGLVPVNDAPDVPYSPMFRYPWTRTLAALQNMPVDGDGAKRLRYTNPVDGGPVILTLDSYAWELSKGQETQTARSSANAVCLVVDGDGVSRIGDETFQWQRNDVFTVPHWRWASHKAVSDTAHIFMFTDREVIKRLHFLREETRD